MFFALSFLVFFPLILFEGDNNIFLVSIYRLNLNDYEFGKGIFIPLKSYSGSISDFLSEILLFKDQKKDLRSLLFLNKILCGKLISLILYFKIINRGYSNMHITLCVNIFLYWKTFIGLSTCINVYFCNITLLRHDVSDNHIVIVSICVCLRDFPVTPSFSQNFAL